MKTEKITVVGNEAYPLSGLLTLPEAEGAVPAVVFVHGSGASNMDEKVGKMTLFKDLAEGLAKHGIASVRYDKRSFAHGLKMVRDKNSVITVKEETIEDAIAAAQLLRKDSRIDPEKIFIVGHSMGAVLAPRIDAEGGNFAGMILMAGTLRKLEEVLVDQTEQMMATMNGLVRRIVGRIVKKQFAGFEGMYELSDAEAKARKMGNGTTAYYFKEMGEHPASAYLEKTEKPILVMQGSKDFQATAEKDYVTYQNLLKDRENVTFRLYEGLNHCFVPAVYGSITKAAQEYKKEQHVGEEVISDIAGWIKSAVK